MDTRGNVTKIARKPKNMLVIYEVEEIRRSRRSTTGNCFGKRNVVAI